MLENFDYVYMIIVDYSNSDYQGIETYLFHTREKAVEVFNTLVRNEKENVFEHAFDENGKILDTFELDTNIEDENETDNLWWNISECCDYYNHTFIDLKQQEIE